MAYHLQKKRFDRLLIALMAGKSVEGADILSVVVMLKEAIMRGLFLDSLYSKAPCTVPMSSYLVLVDLMRVLLRESNNADDFKVMMRAFGVSSLFAMKCEGITISLKSSLRYHEAWSNTDFWMYCTDDLIAKDVERWTRYSSLSFDLLAMDEQQVNGILAINRIQAVLTSMQSIGINEHEQLRQEYLAGIVDYFGLNTVGINILQSPTERFIAWLLDIALVHREEQKPKADLGAPISIDKRSKASELGYCPLQEMLFNVADKLLGLPKKSLGNDDMACICGMPLGGWQPLGIFEKRFSIRENLPCVLCESCYRHILTSPLTSDGSFTHTSRCVVPMTEPEPPTSFSSVFYGHGTKDQRAADAIIDLSGLNFPVSNAPLSRQRLRGRGRSSTEDVAHSDTSQSSNGPSNGGHSRDNSGDHSWIGGFSSSAGGTTVLDTTLRVRHHTSSNTTTNTNANTTASSNTENADKTSAGSLSVSGQRSATGDKVSEGKGEVVTGGVSPGLNETDR
eukprot:gene9027-18696_t